MSEANARVATLRKRAGYTICLLLIGGATVLQACKDGPPPHAAGVRETDPAPRPSVTSAPSSARAGAGTCTPSSVITTTRCPSRVVPASNASALYGCKSDAECTYGKQGRCIKNPEFGGRPPPNEPPYSRPYSSWTPTPAERQLLGGPPPPPRATVCVFDSCEANTDCGASARCACDALPERYACVALDQCLSDAQCGRDFFCSCGAHGQPNRCQPGDCRTDADCNGFTCESGFCHTAKDTCKTQKDCEKQSGFFVCDRQPGQPAWQCREVPPRPPG
jgi:hypothetical protein